MCTKNAKIRICHWSLEFGVLSFDLTGPHILKILVHLTLRKSQYIHSVWSKIGTQFKDGN